MATFSLFPLIWFCCFLLFYYFISFLLSNIIPNYYYQVLSILIPTTTTMFTPAQQAQATPKPKHRKPDSSSRKKQTGSSNNKRNSNTSRAKQVQHVTPAPRANVYIPPPAPPLPPSSVHAHTRTEYADKIYSINRGLCDMSLRHSPRHNQVTGMLFTGLICHPGMMNLYVQVICERLSRGGVDMDTTALHDPTSELYSTLDTFDHPHNARALGDVTSTDKTLSIFIPLRNPTPPGEPNRLPAFIDILIPYSLVNDKGKLMGKVVTTTAIPVSITEGDHIHNTHNDAAADMQPRWNQTININIWRKDLEPSLLLLAALAKHQASACLSPEDWATLAPLIMIVPVTPTITNLPDHAQKRSGADRAQKHGSPAAATKNIMSARGLAIFFYMDPNDTHQAEIIDTVVVTLMGGIDKLTTFTEWAGVPITITRASPGEDANLTDATKISPYQMTNRQYWLRITRLPPEMTSHMLYMVLVKCFHLTHVEGVFMTMDQYNDTTATEIARSAPTFTVILSSPAALAILLSNTQQLQAGMITFIATGNYTKPRNSTHGEVFGFSSPNQQGHGTFHQFPAEQLTRLARNRPLLFTLSTFDTLRLLAKNDGKDLLDDSDQHDAHGDEDSCMDDNDDEASTTSTLRDDPPSLQDRYATAMSMPTDRSGSPIAPTPPRRSAGDELRQGIRNYLTVHASTGQPLSDETRLKRMQSILDTVAAANEPSPSAGAINLVYNWATSFTNHTPEPPDFQQVDASGQSDGSGEDTL